MTDSPGDYHVTLVTASVEATFAFGRALGAELDGRPPGIGAVLLLSGELGSGKTALVQGLAEGLGADVVPKSPTFALQLSYGVRRGDLNHLDLYRLHGELDFVELGLADMFAGPDVVAVEWAERLGAGAPPEALWIRIETTGPDERELRLSGPEKPWKNRVDAARSRQMEGAGANPRH